MSPRPRKASDAEVFAAAQRVMMRLGPGELTLTAIAAEAGVTAGALVQRFGSKRAVLLAMIEAWAAGADEQMAQFRAAYDSPLQALYAYADCIAQMGTSPAELAHHLSYLQLDLTDPDFHRCVKKQAEATRAGLRQLLEEAIAAGELVTGVDTRMLARQVEVTLSGSLWTWAFYQEGTASAWMREDMDALLRPLQQQPTRGAAPKRAMNKRAVNKRAVNKRTVNKRAVPGRTARAARGDGK